mmetsp:Transcript_11201/g.38154  ORF Transcript_11201/g.38154 Transcript_11201/m.38154 type:complete len:375 (-) Transcript_11201:659-1783(-)
MPGTFRPSRSATHACLPFELPAQFPRAQEQCVTCRTTDLSAGSEWCTECKAFVCATCAEQADCNDVLHELHRTSDITGDRARRGADDAFICDECVLAMRTGRRGLCRSIRVVDMFSGLGGALCFLWACVERGLSMPFVTAYMSEHQPWYERLYHFMWRDAGWLQGQGTRAQVLVRDEGCSDAYVRPERKWAKGVHPQSLLLCGLPCQPCSPLQPLLARGHEASISSRVHLRAFLDHAASCSMIFLECVTGFFVEPGGTLQPTRRRSVAELCTELDYIPLTGDPGVEGDACVDKLSSAYLGGPQERVRGCFVAVRRSALESWTRGTTLRATYRREVAWQWLPGARYGLRLRAWRGWRSTCARGRDDRQMWRPLGA